MSGGEVCHHSPLHCTKKGTSQRISQGINVGDKLPQISGGKKSAAVDHWTFSYSNLLTLKSDVRNFIFDPNLINYRANECRERGRRSSSRDKMRKEGRCYKCGRRGHKQRDCSRSGSRSRSRDRDHHRESRRSRRSRSRSRSSSSRSYSSRNGRRHHKRSHSPKREKGERREGAREQGREGASVPLCACVSCVCVVRAVKGGEGAESERKGIKGRNGGKSQEYLGLF